MRNLLSFLTVTAFCVLTCHTFAAADRTARTRELVAVVQSPSASFYDRARACQQLGEIGTREAVPALAATLTDERLSAYARSGLEGISHPSAAEALRAAAGTLTGNLRIGVINSLGTLRDEKAVPLLTRFATNADTAEAAYLALGRIANRESLRFIEHALTDTSPSTRSNAAAACLLAGDSKRGSDAAELYDLVRRADVSAIYRAAATHGAIVARKAKGADLLIEQLHSPERVIRNAAVMSVRAISSDRLASRLNAELKQVPADLQVQLLHAFVDCHNRDSLPLIAARTTNENAEVRKAALAVLGSIGGPSEAAPLLMALGTDSRPEEMAIAQNSLGRLTGPAVDQVILHALKASQESANRVKLIRLLERRNATNAVPTLLAYTAQNETKVSLASVVALKSLASSRELPRIAELLRNTTNETIREAAETAYVAICVRLGREAQGGQAAVRELNAASDTALKCAWIRVIASLGYTNGFPEMLAAAKSLDAALATTALEQLGSWPDAAPVPAVLELLRSAPASRRAVAVNTISRLAGTAADEKQRDPALIVEWLRQADAAAQTVEQRRGVLSALGRVKHIESLRLLARSLDDKTVNTEAAAAIIQIAPAVGAADPIATREALRKIAATAGNANLRSQAAKLAQSVDLKTSASR